MSFSAHAPLSLSDTEEVPLESHQPAAPDTRQCDVASTAPLQHLPVSGTLQYSASQPLDGQRPAPLNTLPGSESTPLSPLSSSSSPSVPVVQERIDSLKAWSINVYKYSRQLISEKLGKSSRTLDAELDGQIEKLRETQRKYLTIVRLARALSSHFYNMTTVQLQLSREFDELGQRSPQLRRQFVDSAATHRQLQRRGDTLLRALNTFVCSVNTLCHKTMDDTLSTVSQFEVARVEYDAYRADLLCMEQCGEYSATGGATSARAAVAKRHYDQRRALYERLHGDVVIKLRFLDENRVKVMHHQLTLLNSAVVSYFAGNSAALDASLLQYDIVTADSAAAGAGSFIESAQPPLEAATAAAAAAAGTTKIGVLSAASNASAAQR